MKHRSQLTLLITLLIGALALFLAACSPEAERNEPVATTVASGTPTTASPAAEVKKRERALLRVIHALPGLNQADLKDDQGTIISLTNYKQVTPYSELKSEVQTLRLTPLGQANAQPLATNNEVMMAGRHYTAIVLPDKNGKAELRVINDNLTPPLEGKVKVRVINAAADIGEIDVYAQGNKEPLFTGVNLQTVTDYNEIAAGTTTLEVRPEGQPKALLTVPNVKLEPLKIYTIVVLGKSKGTPKLETTVITDELVGAPPSTPAPTPTFVK
jgi:Domain of unknown function (DUF4397)